MSFTKKSKRIAFGITLVLALAFTAPPALAGPAATADLGTAVYGWLSDAWQSLTAGVSGSSEEPDRTTIGPKGASSDAGQDPGSSGNAPDDAGPPGPEAELGPQIIPNG